MHIATYIISFFWIFLSPFTLPAHNLVEVRLINPNIQVDMRYATSNNALGYPVYPFPGCFLEREIAERLSRVQQELEKEGYGLRVFDAYRPYSMQPKLWKDDYNHNANNYLKCVVEDDAGHNRGTAVDVTLICLSGCALQMPCEFGDFSTKAHTDYRFNGGHVYHNKFKLEQAMKRQGFIPSPNEWWHFDYCGWSLYPILDVKFEDLVNVQAPCSWTR